MVHGTATFSPAYPITSVLKNLTLKFLKITFKLVSNPVVAFGSVAFHHSKNQCCFSSSPPTTSTAA